MSVQWPTALINLVVSAAGWCAEVATLMVVILVKRRGECLARPLRGSSGDANVCPDRCEVQAAMRMFALTVARFKRRCECLARPLRGSSGDANVCPDRCEVSTADVSSFSMTGR